MLAKLYWESRLEEITFKKVSGSEDDIMERKGLALSIWPT
jgi:hypothetical protein